MKVTPWKEFTKGGKPHRIRARYGIDYHFARRNNQAPYLSITGEIERRAGSRWVEDAGGALHEAIARHFPELARYIKWHLVGTAGPMHYIDNAKYWWELYNGTSEFTLRPNGPNPHDAFMHTVVAEEHEVPPRDTPWASVKGWLEERLEHLLDEWRADMEDLEVLE